MGKCTAACSVLIAASDGNVSLLMLRMAIQLLLIRSRLYKVSACPMACIVYCSSARVSNHMHQAHGIAYVCSRWCRDELAIRLSSMSATAAAARYQPLEVASNAVCQEQRQDFLICLTSVLHNAAGAARVDQQRVDQASAQGRQVCWLMLLL